MVYFSELKGRKVVDSSGSRIGTFEDMVFAGSDQPVVTKLVINKKGELEMIPIVNVKSLSPNIVASDYQPAGKIDENEMYVSKNILDQQIIDISGNKVVRVNDVVIQEKPKTRISGVDIGILGILRWFSLERSIRQIFRRLGIKIASHYLSFADIQPLELARGKIVLRREEKKLKRLLPEDLADHLEKMSIRNISKVIDIMDDKLAADVIESLNIPYQKSVIKSLPHKRAVRMIEYIDPDEAVDILLTLSSTRREKIVNELQPEKKEQIKRLLRLSDTAIGSLMTPEFLTCKVEDSVRKVRNSIKKTGEFSFLNYVYVVNKDNQLAGVINLHELLLNDSDTPVVRIMVPSVVVLYLTTPLDIAIKRLLKYKLEALPVINEKRNILGIVTFDDLAEPLIEKLEE